MNRYPPVRLYSASRYGPVPTGRPVYSAGFATPSSRCRGRIGTYDKVMGPRSGHANAHVSRTVSSPTTSEASIVGTSFTWCVQLPTGGAVLKYRNVKATSSAVNGRPSCQVTSLRMRASQVRGSTWRISSASHGRPSPTYGLGASSVS